MGYITKKEEQARHELYMEVLARLCEMPEQDADEAFESAILLILGMIPESETPVIVAFEDLLNRLARGHDQNFFRYLAEKIYREVLRPRGEAG